MYILYLDTQLELGYSCEKDFEFIFKLNNKTRNLKFQLRKFTYQGLLLYSIAVTTLPVTTPALQNVLPFCKSQTQMVRVVSDENEFNSILFKMKMKYQISPIHVSSKDKIILTQSELDKVELILKRYRMGFSTLENVVLDLRGGEGEGKWILFFAFLYLLEYYSAGAFPLPEFMDPVGAALRLRPKPAPYMSQCPKRYPFERERLRTVNHMSPAETDENGFVMTYDEGYNLIAQTYSGSMQVTDDFRITDWQGVKHIYHGKGVNVNPEQFGMTQKQLLQIKDDGIIAYARKGNKLPSMEHVRAYQESLKNICLDSSTIRRDDSEYFHKHGRTPATVFRKGEYLVAFNQTTGDLITGDKQRGNTLDKFEMTNRMGGQTWIDKWSK